MAIKWLKQGAASAQLAQQEAAAQELRRESYGKTFRYYLKDGEDASLTFVDGDLSPEGYLLPPRYYEHTVKLNGKFENFVCPEQTDPQGGHKCPICEQGDKPALVTLFTVIDHRPYTTQEGKTYVNTRKLLVAKTQSFEMFNKIAIKRGGLAGAKFDVSRTGDKSAAIGSMYDFTEKGDPEELKKKYTRTYKDKEGKEHTVCDFEPLDYEKEIVFRGEEELRKIGFGKGNSAGGVSGFSGSSAAGNGGSAPDEKVDYSTQL